MKNKIVNIVICILLIFLMNCCTVYHNTTSIEREYLNKIINYQGRIIVESKYLPLIKHRAVDFINQYSNIKLQLVSDTLISTEGIDGKYEFTNNDKVKTGYKITISLMPNNKYKVEADCYTTNNFKSKKEREKYNEMLYQNSNIILCYLATNEVMPKFINNTKKYRSDLREEDGYLDL